MPRAGSLSVSLLGSFRAVVRGVIVADSAWPRRQAKLLLKLLALDSKHQLHRQQIMDILWPELDEESAAANLHKIIYMARRALEPGLKSGADSEFILTQEQQVQLRAPGGLWIDSEQFESLAAYALNSGLPSDGEQALALYTGDLLSEDLYADWCARKREHLATLYRELLLKMGGSYEARGQYKPAIGQYEKLIAAEPSNEEAHRELMRLYVLTGRRSEALRQFRRCCEGVRSELDAEPEDATVQLYRKIVAGDLKMAPLSKGPIAKGDSIETLAVLPFDNETQDPSLAYLAQGISESLIRDISCLPELRVLAYSTVSRYRRRNTNPRKIGRELGVRALVSGRVVRFNGNLTIAVELVDTSDGSRIWGEQYRPDRLDVLAIQEQISREISEKLRAEMTVKERNLLVKRYTHDPEAFRLYLKGRFFWNRRTGASLAKAIEFFEKAIEKDPNYALAYSGLADCYNLLSLYTTLPARKTMPNAKAAARKALQIDDGIAEAHTSLAYTCLYYDWDWKAAEHEFQTALALNPNYATAHHWYHEYLTAMGRFEEQMAEILQAQELDPLSLIINTDVGWGLYYAHEYDRAAEQFRYTLELDPGFAVAHLMLGLTHALQRRLDEATACVERAIALSGDSPFVLALGALGYIHSISGRRDEANRLLEDLRDLNASHYGQAMVFAGLDDKRQAIACLNVAFRERHDRLLYLNVDPVFDNLRGDPGFKRLLARIGLPPKAK